MSLPSLLSTVLVAAALAFPLQAQATSVPGTGCPGATDPVVEGTLTPGSRLVVTCPATGGSSQPFVLLGTTLSPIDVTPPLACDTCVLAFTPLISVPGAVATGIPNDPTLVGLCFYAQCAGIQQPQGCLDLSGAVQICIQ